MCYDSDHISNGDVMKKYELQQFSFETNSWKRITDATHPNPDCNFVLATEYFKRWMRKNKIKYSFAKRTHRVIEILEGGYREDPNALIGNPRDYESPNQMFRKSMNDLNRLLSK